MQYDIDYIISCYSTHIVYLHECTCVKQYMGRTTRRLRDRLRGHIYNIRRGYKHHSLSVHFRRVHPRNPKNMKFVGIDELQTHCRGCNKTHKVSKLEMRWVYEIKSFSPFGHNIDWDINCVIDKKMIYISF